MSQEVVNLSVEWVIIDTSGNCNLSPRRLKSYLRSKFTSRLHERMN